MAILDLKAAVLAILVSSVVFAAGCDRKKPAASTSAPAVQPDGAPTSVPAATTSPGMPAVAGDYELNQDDPTGFRHQEKLTLKPDGSATDVVTVTSTRMPGPPKSHDVSVGTYTCPKGKVVVTFTTKNDQPIDKSDPSRVLTLKWSAKAGLRKGGLSYRRS